MPSACSGPLTAANILLRPCSCRYDFDIPILAMDLVIANGQVTLAIVDACPLSSNLMLPAHYMTTMKELQETFLPGKRMVLCTRECTIRMCAMIRLC